MGDLEVRPGISLANPLTHEVDALRALMLTGGAGKFGLGLDSAVLAAIAAVLVVIAARLPPDDRLSAQPCAARRAADLGNMCRRPRGGAGLH